MTPEARTVVKDAILDRHGQPAPSDCCRAPVKVVRYVGAPGGWRGARRECSACGKPCALVPPHAR